MEQHALPAGNAFTTNANEPTNDSNSFFVTFLLPRTYLILPNNSSTFSFGTKIVPCTESIPSPKNSKPLDGP